MCSIQQPPGCQAGGAWIWRLYLVGTIVNFEGAAVGVHQVLAVRLADHGSSGMPLTRAGMV